jgi:hypothetical protein
MQGSLQKSNRQLLRKEPRKGESRAFFNQKSGEVGAALGVRNKDAWMRLGKGLWMGTGRGQTRLAKEMSPRLEGQGSSLGAELLRYP